MTEANENKAIKRIIILGAGLTGWTVAAGLAKGLTGLNIQVILVDDPALCEKDDYSEASMPSLRAFHQFLEINEAELVVATGSTYTLATEYSNWSHEGQRYLLPFSDHGFMLQRMEFAQYFVSQINRGIDYDAYSLGATAARMGRFRHPSSDPASLLSTLDYGLQIHCAKYTRYLMAYAQAMGVQHLKANVISSGLSAKDGALSYLNMAASTEENPAVDDEGKLHGDFFIDCTGQQAWLKNQIEAVDFKDCPFLASNSAVGVTSARVGEIPSASKLYRDHTGWYQQIHTRDSIETRYYFNDALIEPHKVVQQLSDTYAKANADATHVNLQSYRVGSDQNPWSGNCLVIGQSAGYAENFVLGKLHLVQSAVLRFLKLFPYCLQDDWQQQEYNRLTHAEFTHLTDFHALHYHLVNDESSPFWRAPKNHMSDSLNHRLRLFRERATIPFYENETVSSGMWTSLLLGCRYPVVCYNPLINLVDPEWVREQLYKMQNLMAEAAHAMPAHADYLNVLIKNVQSAR